MRNITIIFVSVFLLLLAVNKTSKAVVPDRTSYELPPPFYIPARATLIPFLNFDGRHYLQIALDGYPDSGKILAFFPLYPILIRILSLNLFLNPVAIGLIISSLSSLLACFVLYKLVRLDYSEELAKKSAAFLIIFPSSVYLFAYYPEGLFLLNILLSFYFLKTKKFFLSGIFAALASATKFVGIALFPALLYEGFRYYLRERRIPYGLFLAPMGTIIFGMYTFFRSNDPLLLIQAQANPDFGRSLDVLNPIYAFLGSFQRVVKGPQGLFDSPFVYPVIVLELFWGIFSLLVLYLGFKRFFKTNPGYFIFMLFSLLIPASSGVLSANVRHLIVAFPVFIFLAQIFGRKPIFVIWAFFSVLLLILASTIFLRGYWIA